MIFNAKIIGTGSYVPEKKITNSDLEKLIDTSDEWIQSRTGMRERHIASESETASTMGAEAAKAAIEDAGIDPSNIDLILVATASPDMLFPSTGCLIQNLIGAVNAAAFDISAACSGFIYGLSVADQYIKTGKYKTILLVASDVISKYLDWTDRSTCILFGDGASAVLLTAEKNRKRGILETQIYSDGSFADLLYTRGGGSSCPLTHESVDKKMNLLKMTGNSLFKIAIKKMAEASTKILETCGFEISDVDLIIPHQANIRIINGTANMLNVPEEKVFVNIGSYGNTVAVTVPLALDEAVRAKKVKEGDLILLVAFGGGLTWGAALIRW